MGSPFRPPHDWECPVCRDEYRSTPGMWLEAIGHLLIALAAGGLVLLAWYAGLLWIGGRW